MKVKLPIYEMLIDDELSSDLEIDFIALVDFPAIKRPFLKFNDEFITPSKGQNKESFLPKCIAYVINEGKDNDQAVAICNSIWNEHFAGEKISFDFDDTLSTARGQALAKKEIDNGNNVYIISARHDKEGMFNVADSLGISHDKIFATGSNQAKVEKIKELNIKKHYDNNSDVINELDGIGEKFKFSFAIQNEDQKIISGPLMIPNQRIYRFDKETETEYEVYFSPETIKKIAIKYAKRGFQKNVNIMHNPEMMVPGVTLFEIFQSDKTRGIKAMKGFEDLPDGTLFGSMFVENDVAWDMIKNDIVKGFSVEGNFGMKLKDKFDYQFEKIVDILNDIN
jgi:hypothetical protein